MEDCLFCKILQGEIPSDKVYEDDACYAFRDINPQAPTHVLVVPRQHLASMDEVNEDNAACVAHIFTVLPKIAAAEGLKDGYRVICNCGEHAGQTVKHLHFHLLGGRKFTEHMV